MEFLGIKVSQDNCDPLSQPMRSDGRMNIGIDLSGIHFFVYDSFLIIFARP
jgi:hypothetical protein